MELIDVIARVLGYIAIAWVLKEIFLFIFWCLYWGVVDTAFYFRNGTLKEGKSALWWLYIIPSAFSKSVAGYIKIRISGFDRSL